MASSINASVSGAGGVITTADNTGILNLQTASTTAVTIDASQNVTFSGNTTVSKSQAIQYVTSTTGTNSVYTHYTNTGGSAYVGLNNSTGGDFGNSAYGLQVFHGGAYPIVFSTNATERMRIDSSGNVLVGTTSTLGNAKATFAATAATTTLSIKSGNNGNAGIEFYNTSSASQGYIVINASSVQYLSVSDYRLKENVVPMTGALDKIAQLKPVTYTWKQDGSNGQGFIAHELQAIVPDCVSGEKDAVETYTDEEGNEQTRIKPQGIDTSFLVATLTAAIQEQQTLIVSQSELINSLTARVTALEAK
jgi:hypothetical protein